MFNFNNIGKKIKTMAKISFYLLSGLLIFYGIILIIKTDNDIWGLLWLILGLVFPVALVVLVQLEINKLCPEA